MEAWRKPSIGDALQKTTKKTAVERIKFVVEGFVTTPR